MADGDESRDADVERAECQERTGYVPGHEKILPFVGVALFRSRLMRALRSEDGTDHRALSRKLSFETMDKIDSDVRDALVEEAKEASASRATVRALGKMASMEESAVQRSFSVRNGFFSKAARVAPERQSARPETKELYFWSNRFVNPSVEADYQFTSSAHISGAPAGVRSQSSVAARGSRLAAPVRARARDD